MKYLIFSFLLAPFFVQAQYQYLKLENSQIFFEKIYSIDSLANNGIKKLLLKEVPNLKDLKGFQNSKDTIIAKIENTFIDYKKYGGRWSNTDAFMNYPFSGDILIVWGDGKYKVMVSNMYFNKKGSSDKIKCSDLFTKDKRTRFGTRKIGISSRKYLEKYLADIFLIKKNHE